MVQRIVRQSLVGLAIMLALLFVPTGTLAWPAAWIFLIEFSLASALITRWLLILLFAVRAVMEERTLMAELPGYADYAARVRYRMIPMVWQRLSLEGRRR